MLQKIKRKLHDFSFYIKIKKSSKISVIVLNALNYSWKFSYIKKSIVEKIWYKLFTLAQTVLFNRSKKKQTKKCRLQFEKKLK